MLAVAAARQQLTACENELAAAIDQLQIDIANLESPASANPFGMSVGNNALIAAHCMGIYATKARVEHLQIQKEQLVERHREACDDLAKISREVESFELLRSERLKAHRLEEERRGQIVSDELAERRHRQSSQRSRNARHPDSDGGES